MWHTAHTILRVLAGVAGALSLYAALFLYEDEQGKIQNKLEEWWVGLSDMQSEALSRHTGFMREVARLTTQGFDRLLGPRLLSPSVLMPSSFYSSASLLLCTVVYGFLFHRAYFLHYQPVASLLALGAGLWMGRRTALGRWRNLTATLSLRDLALFFLIWGSLSAQCVLVIGGAESLTASGMPKAYLITLMSFACDMGFIAVTRWSVRWSCELDHTLKIGAVVLVNLGLAVAIFLLPLFLFSKESLPFGMALAFMNSVDALAALIFVVLALVMLAHRLVWPVINRPVYALAALGGARRNLFGVVGVALLGYAGIDLPELLKKIIEATAG